MTTTYSAVVVQRRQRAGVVDAPKQYFGSVSRDDVAGAQVDFRVDVIGEAPKIFVEATRPRYAANGEQIVPQAARDAILTAVAKFERRCDRSPL